MAVPEYLKSIFICVDSYDDSLMQGYVYHGTLDEGRKFDNLMQLLLVIENILDDTEFPKATTEKRRFHVSEELEKSEKALAESRDFSTKKGKLASFKLRIIFRQNASWQGSLGWLEHNIDEPFRSAIEMIMLMDSAVSNQDD